MKNHQEVRTYKFTKCTIVTFFIQSSKYFLLESFLLNFFFNLQTFKFQTSLHRHSLTCRSTKSINESDDEEREESAIFHAVMEQIGLHQVKKMFHNDAKDGLP